MLMTLRESPPAPRGDGGGGGDAAGAGAADAAEPKETEKGDGGPGAKGKKGTKKLLSAAKKIRVGVKLSHHADAPKDDGNQAKSLSEMGLSKSTREHVHIAEEVKEDCWRRMNEPL